MFNHEPADYTCPFCVLVQGGEGKHNSQQDIVYRDSDVLAFISPGCWPHNAGHVIIVPTEHYENIYVLPLKYASGMHKVARNVAIAFKRMYSCDGISTRQHNEPDGGQDVWHYHGRLALSRPGEQREHCWIGISRFSNSWHTGSMFIVWA